MPVEISEHRGVDEFFGQTTEVSGRNVEEEGPVGQGLGQEGLTKESGEDAGSILPPSEPIVGPELEFAVKQEWVEQCEKRRLPLKKRYQLQFSETMRLK